MSPSLPFALALLTTSALAARAIEYPAAARGTVTDNYHGTTVADPYRWLEDLDGTATQTWVEAQNRLTFGFLATLPARDKFKARLTALWNYPKFGLPQKRRRAVFFHQERGFAEPERALRAVDAGGRAAGAARSKHVGQGRHGRAHGDGGLAGRQMARLRHGGGGFGLERVPGAVRRDGRGCGGCDQVGEVFRARVDARQQRLFLFPLRRAGAVGGGKRQDLRRAREPESTTTALARRRARTG